MINATLDLEHSSSNYKVYSVALTQTFSNWKKNTITFSSKTQFAETFRRISFSSIKSEIKGGRTAVEKEKRPPGGCREGRTPPPPPRLSPLEATSRLIPVGPSRSFPTLQLANLIWEIPFPGSVRNVFCFAVLQLFSGWMCTHYSPSLVVPKRLTWLWNGTG